MPALRLVERPTLCNDADLIQRVAADEDPIEGRSRFTLPEFRLGAVKEEKHAGYKTHPVRVADLMPWGDTVDGPVGRYRSMFQALQGKTQLYPNSRDAVMEVLRGTLGTLVETHGMTDAEKAVQPLVPVVDPQAGEAESD